MTEGRTLPADLSNALVFANTDLTKLKSRAREIGDEKKALRRRQKALRAEYAGLAKELQARGTLMTI